LNGSRWTAPKQDFSIVFASGAYDGQQKLSVISGTILKTVDIRRELLGGQSINPIVYDILHAPDGRHHDYSYGDCILFKFLKETEPYFRGKKEWKTAIADFYQKYRAAG
jgi:hypothetical protein